MRKLFPAVNSDQISKWFGTSYGFVLGIAAALLTVSTISLLFVGSLFLIGYLYQEYITARKDINCIDRKIAERRAYLFQEGRPEAPYLDLQQVNICRKSVGLQPLTKEAVKTQDRYRKVLEPKYFE